MGGWGHETSFRDKLSQLTESQDSIQTLSRWVHFHKAHAAEAAAVWAAETLRTQAEDRRLLYIYLANDVIQNSRRKRTPCADAFAAVLLRVLPVAYSSATPAVQLKIDRLLTIWEERLALSAETIAALRRVRSLPPWPARAWAFTWHAALQPEPPLNELPLCVPLRRRLPMLGRHKQTGASALARQTAAARGAEAPRPRCPFRRRSTACAIALFPTNCVLTASGAWTWLPLRGVKPASARCKRR